MRLIDADALMVDLNDELGFQTPMFTAEQNKYIDYGLRVAITDLKYQPTVDAVEVVRCKDCKWGCSPYGDEDDGWTACANIHGRPIFRDEHFCSSGERRTDVQITD